MERSEIDDKDIVIASTVRTPFGRYCGILKEYDYFDLGAIPMKAVLDKVNGRSTRWEMLQELERMGVKSKTATKALEITPTSLKVQTGNSVEEIEADTVVLAIGARPYNPIKDLLNLKGIPCWVIGDAQKIGRAFEAIHQGFEAGRNLAANWKHDISR